MAAQTRPQTPKEPHGMSTHLTAGQRALLQAALTQRQHELDRRLAAHHQGASRAEHARQVLLQDGDDAPQRDGEREVDMALSDLELQELGRVSDALRRVQAPGFGLCADCGEAIALARLKVEPWALRCVACETLREAHPHAPPRL
jgi:DnaK suppressor protein